jgi:hypothetical protein
MYYNLVNHYLGLVRIFPKWFDLIMIIILIVIWAIGWSIRGADAAAKNR